MVRGRRTRSGSRVRELRRFHPKSGRGRADHADARTDRHSRWQGESAGGPRWRRRSQIFGLRGRLPVSRLLPGALAGAPRATARYRWYVASSGAGFTGLTLRLEIEGTAPLRVEGIGLSVYRFYNGQVTSMTPVAEHAGPLPAEGVVEIADFTVPTVEPQTRRQFLLQLDVNVRMPEAGEATLIPVLAPLEPEVQSPSLPPLRLAA